MAEDILSQEEVDALLRGVSTEAEAETASGQPPQGGIRTYDIGRQERIVRGRMPTLELINERFARAMRIALFNFTRRNTEIVVGPLRVLKYSEFVRNLVVPTNLNLVQLKPLRGTALMVLEPGLVFQMVDQLFGGQGKSMRVEGREFTPTEMRIIRRMLEMVFDCYQRAWEPVFTLECEYVRSELNTQFVSIALPNEVVVITSFSIDQGSGSADFHLCMPYAMLEPIRDVIYSTVQADRSDADSRWVDMLTRHVHDTEVELTVNLASTDVTLRQLLTLQAGDVIALDLDSVVTADVDGVPVMRCSYGVVEGKYALKVERALSSGA
jgi:flagellar motor switch protein FliM